jgi:glyoxylase-like metal-dependent hydrolase (beta-lactamase superfamily II)
LNERGIHELRPGVVGFKSVLVWSYLLYDEREVVAIDSGLGPHGGWIKQWFKRTKRSPKDLKGILLTHGHVDHVGCAASLQKWSGAPIFLHPADSDLALGRYAGPWSSKRLEMIERSSNLMFWIRRLRVTDELRDGQQLPMAGGLRVIHLPGHTSGQVGFYSEREKILFAADSVLSRGSNVFFPHRIFNEDDRLARRSVFKLADLDADWVYPAHHTKLGHNIMTDLRRYRDAKLSLQGVESPPTE